MNTGPSRVTATQKFGVIAVYDFWNAGSPSPADNDIDSVAFSLVHLRTEMMVSAATTALAGGRR